MGKKKEKHDEIVLIAKSKINSIEQLTIISWFIIVYNIVQFRIIMNEEKHYRELKKASE